MDPSTSGELDPSIDAATVAAELAGVSLAASRLADVSVVACCPLMVRFRVRRTPVKEMDVCLNFPPDYPATLILMEVKSRSLPTKFTESVPVAFEKEKANFVGKHQVIPALRFALDFLDSNSLCYCAQEISNLRKSLPEGEGNWLKVRQKSCSIVLRVQAAEYFLEAKLEVPDSYPAASVALEIRQTNFPSLFQVFFFHQARELGRQAVQPPLLRRKKGQKAPPPPPRDFKPKPSLELVGRFLIQNAARYPLEDCSLCKKRAFPSDPSLVEEAYETAAHIERVYCGHIFHFACIDVYMNTPPFKGGKACPACQAIIYHDKWKDSERTREDRWAHKEAKARELDEVADFLA